MVIVGITAKKHLLSLAYALVKGENNNSWSWFLTLIKKEVLGPGRSIYMILDCHCGFLNGAKEHLDGYPPPYTQVVYTSFCHKHLEEATEQGSYRKVEGIVQG
jgi:hypothetical protein